MTSYQILRYFNTQGTQKQSSCYYTFTNILPPRDGWSRTFREHSPFWTPLPAGGVIQTGINLSAKPFRKESSFTQFPLHLSEIAVTAEKNTASRPTKIKWANTHVLKHSRIAPRPKGWGKEKNKNPALPFPQGWFLTSKRHNPHFPFISCRNQFSNRNK